MRIESLVFGKANFYTEATENAEFAEKSLASLRLESPAVSLRLQQNKEKLRAFEVRREWCRRARG